MPRRAYQEQRFDPAKPVIVRRAFTGGGRHWRPGDTFDWQRLSVDRRRVRQLFDAGKLRHEEAADERVDRPKPLPPVSDAEKVSEGTGEPMQAVEHETIDHDGPAPALEPDPDAPMVSAQGSDDLDAIDDMKELRRIATEEGAPFKVSKVQQRQAIRDHRNA